MKSDEILLKLRHRLGFLAGRNEISAFVRRSGLSYAWVRKFMRGEIRNPGIQTLERLENELAAWANRRDAWVETERQQKALARAETDA